MLATSSDPFAWQPVNLDNFSLMRGGAVHRLLTWSGALRGSRRISRAIAVVLILVTFLPLAVACALDGTLLVGRVAIPLLADYAVLSRLLVAVPVLVLAAPPADHLLRGAIRQFSRGGFVRGDDQRRYGHWLGRARSLRDAWWPELICLVIALLPGAADPVQDLGHLGNWHNAGHATTWAGQWFDRVSVPVFRFLALLWIWRFLLWSWLLWRMSRLSLDLRAPHPDAAGGLAFLGLAQTRFAVLAFTGSVLLSGFCVNHFLYAGQTLNQMRYLLLGYIAGAPMLLLAPLLLMAPPMVRAKRHALSRYAILGHRAIRQFDARWKKGPPDMRDPALIDSDNSSALADFSAVYANVARMSIVPINRRDVLWMLLAAAVPLAPLVFLAMSLDELAQRLASILV